MHSGRVQVDSRTSCGRLACWRLRLNCYEAPRWSVRFHTSAALYFEHVKEVW